MTWQRGPGRSGSGRTFHFCPGSPVACHATSALPAGTDADCDDSADLSSYRSLLECLAEGPEPRHRCGIRHQAAVVLAFTVTAVLAGADSVTAIAEWTADMPPEALAALGAWRDRKGRLMPPSRSMFRRVLRKLDAGKVACRTWYRIMTAVARPYRRVRAGTERAIPVNRSRPIM